uniref:condensation domain-containing protein n=1 Tax=Flexibacterium corallicola TaxID=3037259 RepID=UPI00286F712B
VLERYEVLRTRLVSRDTRLWQEIDPPESLQNVFEDWSQEGQPLEALQERVARLLAAAYDLSTDHPCRSLVLKLSPTVHVWCLATHHSVGDNWSLSHVLPRFCRAVSGRQRGTTSYLAPLTATLCRLCRLAAVRGDGAGIG